MRSHHVFPLTPAIIASLIGSSVVAQDKGTQSDGFTILPQSTAEVGVGGVLGEARYRGIFDGRNDQGAYAALNADIALREDRTGTWFRLQGHNLGLDNREMRVEHERQGDWKLYLDIGQSTSTSPLEFTTGLTGIEGNNQVVSGAGPRMVDLEVGRDWVKTGLSKLLGERFNIQVDYRLEEKRGERQFGAWSGAKGFNFLTEPVEFVTQEIAGSASYTGERLQLTGGYLGNIFRNENEVLFSNSGEPNIALPVDNQAHQVHLAGAYAVTPKTRATFKTSYGIALQNEEFFTSPTFPGNDRRDLGGRVDTLLAQVGLSARPIDDMSINGKVRYEDRDDKTKRAQYITASPSRSGLNIPFSRTTTTAELEASYSLPMRFRVTGGVKQEHWSRSKPTLRQASFRDNTDETSYSIELRRSLVNSLGGAIAYVRSERTGSNWNDGSDGRIDAINLGDRERDKMQLSLNWAPMDRFSVQFRLEYSTDAYDSRPLGPRDGETRLASVDLSYDLSRDWNLSGWMSLNDVRLDQATNGDGTSVSGAAITDEDWAADLRHLSKEVGFSVRGRLTTNLSTGAEIQYSTDRSEHELTGLGASAIPSLPDIRYQQASLRLFFDHRVAPNGRVRINYGYSRISAEDWTWQNWTYADGTTVHVPEREETHFIGVAYSYRW